MPTPSTPTGVQLSQLGNELIAFLSDEGIEADPSLVSGGNDVFEVNAKYLDLMLTRFFLEHTDSSFAEEVKNDIAQTFTARVKWYTRNLHASQEPTPEAYARVRARGPMAVPRAPVAQRMEKVAAILPSTKPQPLQDCEINGLNAGPLQFKVPVTQIFDMVIMGENGFIIRAMRGETPIISPNATRPQLEKAIDILVNHIFSMRIDVLGDNDA
jgi:hypothetical protein